MDDIRKLKKAELLCYASELERKLKKAEAEVERVKCRQTKEILESIRRDEKIEWVETGFIHALDAFTCTCEELEACSEIDFDLSYRLRQAMQSSIEHMDFSYIVGDDD